MFNTKIGRNEVKGQRKNREEQQIKKDHKIKHINNYFKSK